MNKLKKHLIEACERKFDYYDIVDEGLEMVDYGLIIDFLFEQICELMIVRAEDGK
jgi:hypothetical protein